MATTTYGDISQRTAAWAATKMLSHAEPILCLSKFGQPKPVPKNEAKSVKFRRPVPFDLAKTPLQEGVTPTAQQMKYEDVEASLDQYGATVTITDHVADMSEDPVLSDSSQLCGEQAAETVESLTWGVLQGGSNVIYANGSSRSAVNTAISLNKQRAATRSLKRQRGKKLTSMVGGSPNDNTTPIEPAYIAFGHTDLEPDIRALDGFRPTSEYGQRKALPYEIGSVEDVRYILTPVLEPILAAGAGSLNGMTSEGGSNVDVYPLIIVAKEAYGMVTLKGARSMTPMVLNPGTPRGGDPLGQRGSVSWKTYFKAVILNEAWLQRLEVGATDYS